MKLALFLSLFFMSSFLRQVEGDSYFLSSEKIVQENQGSLKELQSVVFFPLLKTEEKETKKIRRLIHEELERVGTVTKEEVLKPEGADLACFSNPSLQFTIEQLVDQDNKPIPFLKATLSVSSVVEILSNKECNSLSISHWSVQLKKSDDVKKVVKQTLPSLLDQFIADYQRANGKDRKPIFFVTYTE